MKKGFKLLSLLLCMSLFMTGCGPLKAILAEVDRSEASDEQESEEASSEEQETEETVSEESKTEESKSEESKSEEPGSQESTSEAKETEEATTSFSVGEVKGQTYTNEYLGIQCVLDKTWTYTDEEGLILIYNQTNEVLGLNFKTIDNFDDETIEVVVNSDRDVNIMSATGFTGAITVSIGGNVNSADMPGGKTYEDFITGYAGGQKYGLVLAGSSDVTTKLESVNFMGKETDCVSSVYKRNGMDCYQKTLFIYKDNYRVTLTVLSFVDEESAVQLLDNIKACEGADFIIADATGIVIADDVDSTGDETNESVAVLGYVEDDVYINKELGLQCKLGSAWDFASIEELEASSNMTYDEESVNDALSSGKGVDVLKAESLGGTVTVMIADSEALWGGAPLDLMQDLLAEIYKATLTEGLSAQYEKFELVRTEEDFMGEEAYLSFDADITHRGIEVHQRQVYQPMGEYFVTIVATGVSDEVVQEMMDSFSKYEP